MKIIMKIISDYSEENTCENEVFCFTIERNWTYSRLSYRFITHSIRLGDFDWCQCQKQPLKVFCEKSSSLKFAKFTGNSCATGSTCKFCKIFNSNFFTEQFRTTTSESGCSNSEVIIDCICCRELDAMLIASAEIPECEGRISPSSFYGHLPDY